MYSKSGRFVGKHEGRDYILRSRRLEGIHKGKVIFQDLGVMREYTRVEPIL